MIYDLPVSVELDGAVYPIRSDYRAALDMCAALVDPELSNEEKAETLLAIFYPGWEEIPAKDYQEAINRCLWFLNCGSEEQPTRKAPKLMDWQQDFPMIVAPVNRVIGREIREPAPLHWWTFISAYYEIGDCLFAQVVRIRSLKARGKPLDKADREWYRQNRELVDLKTTYTEAERELLAQFVKKQVIPCQKQTAAF